MSGTSGISIDERIAACAAKWSLTLGAAYAPAVRSAELPDGTPVVLKLSNDSDCEAAALQAFGGRGAVALLAHDSSLAALLLARAQPGHPLAQLCYDDDERATSIAASLARKLARPVPDDGVFPSAAAWESDLERSALPLAADARAVLRELIASAPETFLLHGDLHQYNILANGDGWIAVDPEGLIGERACEIAPLVLNPIDLAARHLTRRIDQLSEELELDRERAWAWTFVRTVLAASWCVEDDGAAPPEWLECAARLTGRR